MYYSVKWIANELAVDKRTIRRWIADGKLKAVKIQGVVRIKDDELNRFLEGGKR